MCTLLVATLLLASSQALVYELQNSSSSNSNGTWWVVARVVIKVSANSIEQTVCNENIDSITAGTLCRLSGYKAASIITSNEYSFNSSVNLGYEKALCGESSNIGGCDFTAVLANTTCTNLQQLVLNCSDHYKASIPTLSGSDLIIPLVLIPACIFYVTLLCYLEYEDVKAKQEKKQLSMKQTVSKVLQDNITPEKSTPVTKEAPAV